MNFLGATPEFPSANLNFPSATPTPQNVYRGFHTYLALREIHTLRTQIKLAPTDLEILCMRLLSIFYLCIYLPLLPLNCPNSYPISSLLLYTFIKLMHWSQSLPNKDTGQIDPLIARLGRVSEFGSGVLFNSGSGFLSLDPDPVFQFLWIRIRFQPPNPGAKNGTERALKVIY